jgi:phosphate transport system permease protein
MTIEKWVERALFASALFCSLCVTAVFGFLVYFSWPLFLDARGFAAVFSWTWKPFAGQFGILAMVAGTFSLALLSLGIAYPMAVGIACFSQGLAPARVRGIVLGLVYFMTSIPTVIYGFVSVFILVPLFRDYFEHGTGFCLAASAITLGILIVPTVVISLNAQMSQRSLEVHMAARSLGLTPVQEVLWVLLPCSAKGLVIAAVLGFGRAVGDTLVALMVSGYAPVIPHSLLDPIRALTAHIALVVATDSQDQAYYSIFASGLMLFLIMACLTMVIRSLGGTLGKGKKRNGSAS